MASYAQTNASLDKGFASPPDSARPWVYWFWLNGNITREGITADLEAMKRVGIGGVLIMEVDQGTPLGPIPFASDKWRELFHFVVTEADRLGLQVNMTDDAGWNGSGGPWVPPDKAMQKVVWSETQVSGPAHFDAALPQPPVVRDYYRDITVLAFPTPGDYRIPDIEGKSDLKRGEYPARANFGEAPAGSAIDRGKIVDLSGKMTADGHLTWDAPEGKWTVLRLGHTCTGATNEPSPASGRGLECDKLSTEGSEAAFNGFIEKLANDSGPLTGRALVKTHIDSWENGSQNWTARMPEEFRRLRGYDLTPYLPAMTGRVVQSLEVSERFLDDLRQTCADLLSDNYAGHIRDLANKHGMRLTIEAYGDSPADNMAYAGRADEPMGEFWSWPSFGAEGTLIEMSSAAHVWGKPICGAESFTAGDGEKWLYHPGYIKAMGDTAFCLGIQRFVFHRFAMQPWRDRRPGMSMGPWGLHYERTQTWWEQSKPWHEYLARCQFLLQKGMPVVDVLYLEPEGAPRSFNPPPSGARAGYKGDGCPTEALLKRASVKDGRIVFPDGMSYRALALPGAEAMTPGLVKRLAEMASDGATIVGGKPQKATGLTDYPQSDAEVKQRADALWNSGKVIAGKTPEQVLAAKGVPPDFKADRTLNFVHRRIDGAEVYFVANTLSYSTSATCAFRVAGKRPELWHPETGKIEPVATYTEAGGQTRMPLQLDGGGSVFVVFRQSNAGDDPIVRLDQAGKPIWPVAPRKVKITVRRALWGPTETAGQHTKDVTAQLQAIVDGGATSLTVADLASDGDPAPNIVKTLRVEYEVGGKTYSAKGTDPERITFTRPTGDQRIVIRHAVWGPAGDEEVHGTTKDVTRQVQGMVDRGGPSFVVADLVSEGDPAPNMLKTLTVEYEAEGQILTATATDPDTITLDPPPQDAPPLRLERLPGGRLVAETTKPGLYEIETKSGRKISFRGQGARSVAVEGAWDLQFPPNWGAPEHVKLDRLASWSENADAGVRYFSGTATYRKAIQVPQQLLAQGRRVYLDLGQVEVMARVILNGKDLGILWKSPYRVEITGAVRPGENTLEIQATNLWPNRMIGDEQLPEDSSRASNGTLKEWPKWLDGDQPSPTGRFTFTSWRLWRKSDKLLPSGVIGPVRVESEGVETVGG
jgi:hypothetical protein